MRCIDEKKISVIVAIYNVEKYLKKCIESILNQTYTNLEIILINDGSSDNCKEICDKYAMQDSRIKVVHRENKGVAYTRNQGIDMATGDYITFVDSDDYIHPQMYEIMMNYMQNSEIDVVICDYETIAETDTVNIIKKDLDKMGVEIIETGKQLKKYMYLEQYNHALLVWNKIFKKELWEGIRCPEGRVYEDETVTFKILHKAGKIVNIKDKLYYHVIRSDESSITTIPFSLKRLQRLDALEVRIDYYIEKQEWEFLAEAFFAYKTDYLVIIEHILKSQEYSMDILKAYIKKYRSYCWRYLLKMQIPAKKKLQYVFFGAFPIIYYKRYKKRNS